VTIYTIGYNKKSLRRFIDLLRDERVDAVLDVRLHNTSQLAGFTKRDDLAFILELVGIAYRHLPELAPSEEVLSTYKKGRDWSLYEASFTALMAERKAMLFGIDVLSQYQRPCLLCAEEKPDHCHRRLLAESFATRLVPAEIRHLI